MFGPGIICSEDQVCDAIGEICHMVAGNFKNKLIGLVNSCMLSVPAVVTGRSYPAFILWLAANHCKLCGCSMWLLSWFVSRFTHNLQSRCFLR
jgi:hypothetical protein